MLYAHCNITLYKAVVNSGLPQTCEGIDMWFYVYNRCKCVSPHFKVSILCVHQFTQQVDCLILKSALTQHYIEWDVYPMSDTLNPTERML